MVESDERERAEIESIEIRLLLEAVHARYGYDLRDYAPPSIRRRVLAALASSGSKNLGELQHRLLRDRDLFADVLDKLTVHVSEMFRDPELYRALRAEVVPLLMTYPLLKIWHAGCATGEEAYTSAILLHESGLYDRAQIYATDLNPRALERAKEGIYSAVGLDAFEKNHAASGAAATQAIAEHISIAYDQMAMRASLGKNVLFFQHDLVSDHVFGEMHVVFCRNVLIYFNRQLRERVLRKIAESIIPGGFLCLGDSERLPESTSDFVPFARSIYRRC